MKKKRKHFGKYMYDFFLGLLDLQWMQPNWVQILHYLYDFIHVSFVYVIKYRV